MRARICSPTFVPPHCWSASRGFSETRDCSHRAARARQ
jgi:hypothetical protein